MAKSQLAAAVKRTWQGRKGAPLPHGPNSAQPPPPQDPSQQVIGDPHDRGSISPLSPSPPAIADLRQLGGGGLAPTASREAYKSAPHLLALAVEAGTEPLLPPH